MLKYLFPLVFIIQCITNCIAQPLDKTFGNNGVLITPFDTYLYGNGDNIQAIAQQQDGKILSADGYFRIVRFLPNGKVAIVAGVLHLKRLNVTYDNSKTF